MKPCGIVRRKTMHHCYIVPALTDGTIERKYPEQPNHPKQNTPSRRKGYFENAKKEVEQMIIGK
ncbi:Fic family protein [Hallella sp.]|uniref:Fic family protein n=1 Tax=Hallella sp. TaxID=2980186 RepID=UPI00307A9959